MYFKGVETSEISKTLINFQLEFSLLFFFFVEGSRDVLSSFFFHGIHVFYCFYDRLTEPYLGKISIVVDVMKAIAGCVNDFKKVIMIDLRPYCYQTVLIVNT